MSKQHQGSKLAIPVEPDKVDRGARRKARTRKKLLDAAVSLIRERDLEAISIVDITEAADVGLGTFYNHFESKQILLKAMADEFLVTYEETLDAMVADVEDIAEVFVISYRYTLMSARNEDGWNIIRQMPHHFIRDKLEQRSFSDMNKGIESGRFKVSGAENFGKFLNNAVVGILWGLADGAVTMEQAESYVEYFLKLLGVKESDVPALMAVRLPL